MKKVTLIHQPSNQHQIMTGSGMNEYMADLEAKGNEIVKVDYYLRKVWYR
jgi:hypothetical protein